eukprot:CAMPEP_0114416884 /NCGR_PEP_ID=MMETSP0103-20121206/2669_1 /TAXON_ID=37642 ORGANISM="Paraphysomonas imperforata, Strain PA2" /NCGR_SAMPLE_ID=MMETSP0103 /ASSEMBLY_ACC=CAM_ASM_000201 /LENGTH=87 /DNA_ID=CAMNT_0001585141 /DNA_START=23 /DNA_END=286 /DNA_ORIENTATION=+
MDRRCRGDEESHACSDVGASLHMPLAPISLAFCQSSMEFKAPDPTPNIITDTPLAFIALSKSLDKNEGILGMMRALSRNGSRCKRPK